MSDIQRMEPNQENTINPQSEISLKNFINKIKEYNRAVLKSWLLLLILAGIFIAISVWQTINAPLLYPGQMTFMVNEEPSSGGGSVGGFLNQFGFGSSSSGSYNLSKVLELSRSREITKRALFTRDSSLAKPDFLINKVIEVYGLQDIWAESNPDMANFVFKHNDFERFSREENSALKAIHIMLVGGEEGGGFVKLEVNSETSIFKMMVNSKEEFLSINLLNAIYVALSDFYISETTEKPRMTFLNLKARTDSVRSAMMSLEYRLANNIDTNRGLITQKAKLIGNRLERELRAAAVEYEKLLENQATSDFTLQNATPVFQIIDPVLEPIYPKKGSVIKAAVIGGFIGIFLGIIYVLMRKIYRDAMAE